MKNILILFILFLLTLAGAHNVEIDGTLRGRASVGLLQYDMPNRCIKLAFCPFGPNNARVYWRLQVTS